jgi:hypothetical protein
MRSEDTAYLRPRGSVESVSARQTELAQIPNVTKPFNIASYALLTHMLAQFEEFEILDYRHHEAIKAPIAV